MSKFTRTSFKLFDLLIVFVMVFGSPMSALAAPSPTGATIASDLADYPPGGTVTLTGAGWGALEEVHIVVNDTIGQTWKRDVTVTADESGNLIDVFNLPDYFISDYDVTASGPVSGSATTTFTDAQGSFSKPYAHWSDEPLPGDWNNNILNDNKSNYFEGEVIPHVFMYGASNNAQLVNGQSYSFNVTYNWYQQNTDAGGFAYMTQYNLSRQPNVFDWATPAIAPVADSTFANGGGMAAGTSFYTVDADITNVTAVTYTGSGTKDGHVTITFTYTGTTTSNGYAAIYYGLYIAKPGEVPDQGTGKTNGANAWSGGSLQTTVDIGGSGATSIQLAPSAIIAGEISGLKFNDLNGNGTKDSGEPGLAGWTICLDSDNDPNNGNLGCVQTANGTTDDLDGNGVIDPVGFYYFSVTPGTYYVYEVNQNGWTQTAPSTVYYGPLVVSATTATYLNMNFGNAFNTGSLKITKTTSNPDGATLPAAFTGTYDCGGSYTGNWSVPNGGSQTISGIPTGSVCTVSEVAPTPIPGYTWGTVSYTPASVTIGTNTTVEIVVGNSITKDTGSFKITKSTSNPGGATLPAAFTGTYDCGGTYTGNWSVPDGGSQTISGIPTGSVCTVSEVTPAPIPGYTWGMVTYTPASVTIGNNTTVEIVVGNSITRDLGSLVLAKSLTGGPDGFTGPFQINYDCDGTAYDGSVSVEAGQSQTVSNIPTGTSCTISETLPDAPTGYSFGTPTFSPSATVTIPAGNGSSVSVTTNNTLTRDTGSLKVNKTLNDGGSGFSGNFSINYDCGDGLSGTLTVPPGGSSTVTGIPTGSSCIVSEPTLPTPPTGYSWGDPVITGSPAAITTKGATVEVTVANSLTRDLGSLKILKTVNNPDGATLPASFLVDYDCGTGYTGQVSVAPGSPATVNGIPTASTCTVTEVAPADIPGYTWGTITYTPASVTIDTKGDTFEITVGNSITRDRGSLEIKKTLSNPDSANVPASFTVNYDCGTGYTGQVSVAPGSPATVSGIPTGNTCTVTEVAPIPIPNYTWGVVTYTPASVTIDTKGQTFTITVGNSITRDRGYLTIVKKVVNDHGGTATVSAFGVNTSAGSLTFDSGTANGTTTTYTSQKITVVTGNYTLKENDVYGYTEGTWSCIGAAGTVVPTYNNGSVQVGKDEDVTCTITNDDQPGTIIIKKIVKGTNLNTSFSYTTTGTGYNNFSLSGGSQDSQTVNAGTYSVTELVPLGWVLTGIGGSTDPSTPYACTVSGSGGSSGSGDLNTMTASIELKNGDTVTCVFENTGPGVTRTQGFWATHAALAKIAWEGGTAFGHTFPGVAGVAGIGDTLICGRDVDASNLTNARSNQLMGGFWSDISKKSTRQSRSSLDQSRMQLLQQLLAAELNASAFGSVPSSGSFAAWEAALCGTNQSAINTAKQQAASFNSQGDSSTFTPGTSADSRTGRFVADIPFWDIIKP